MGRQPCCDKAGMRRGAWTAEEDQKLINFIINNGIHCWRLVPKLAGLMRCGKSCRLRWTNYLRPDLKREAISQEEESQIIQLHSRLGNRWSKIASYFPGRTDNEIKNHWNTRIKKRLNLLGLNPATHELINPPNASPQMMIDMKQKEIGVSSEDKSGYEHRIWMTFQSMNAEENRLQVNSSGSCSSSFSVQDSLCPSSSKDNSFPSSEATISLDDLFFYGNLL
ncbi:unnamed protein product [Musa acuminata subsp. malaccensis]|uniref:(wild Malaysian banana) hypothetical protein n=1 Tax=Musa acuminata subsp. malaccensis TaxID=214687 RepID=A0A804JE10_MUSAM|nr:PREDICTED: protein ODORANT1-like [Musa acuminata subsp. malaccensis]CAG1845661.1 unnamed protein product [Musa acuminata subsp. malaccensis]